MGRRLSRLLAEAALVALSRRRGCFRASGLWVLLQQQRQWARVPVRAPLLTRQHARRLHSPSPLPSRTWRPTACGAASARSWRKTWRCGTKWRRLRDGRSTSPPRVSAAATSTACSLCASARCCGACMSAGCAKGAVLLLGARGARRARPVCLSRMLRTTGRRGRASLACPRASSLCSGVCMLRLRRLRTPTRSLSRASTSTPVQKPPLVCPPPPLPLHGVRCCLTTTTTTSGACAAATARGAGRCLSGRRSTPCSVPCAKRGASAVASPATLACCSRLCSLGVCPTAPALRGAPRKQRLRRLRQCSRRTWLLLPAPETRAAATPTLWPLL